MIGKRIRRGDIYYADLRPVVGCEQGGIRPVVILQNNTGNRFSPTTIAAAVTSQDGKHQIPTHIRIDRQFHGLHQDSMILLEQVRTLDQKRLLGYIGCLDQETLEAVDRGLTVSLGMRNVQKETEDANTKKMSRNRTRDQARKGR